MVRVNNLDETSERSQLTRPDVFSPQFQEQFQGLVRVTPILPHPRRGSEPGHLDFTGPSIYGNCDSGHRMHRPMTDAERNFTPDLTYSGVRAREFLDKMNEQRHKPVELNSDGKYEVKPGDTLATIAERTLRKDGHSPSQAEIQARTKELERLNGDQIGNRHLLKPGMHLRLTPGADDTCRRAPDKTRQSGSSAPRLAPEEVYLY
ncbi:MAG: LysM peptidoglycan-binding domain-containing protein [Cyanobacteria bacterium SZAS LIN-2]|nr:LysM peptidoglycan-binding domain-containing protein [Cyanobacteria bacterium SZAS LIN-2]